MKAVILAAGKGTRMRHLTDNTPKPMIEVGRRHILERIFDAIRSTGIRDFVVVTGYHANVIEDHFGDGSGHGLRIVYVRQTTQDGTGSALRICREAVGNDPFFMSFGDIITSVENYPALIAEYRRRPCAALLGVNEVEDPTRGAAVYVDDGWNVERIVEKPPAGESTTNLNNSGLFVFDPVVFDYTDLLELSPRKEYELTDVFPAMIRDGLSVHAFPLRGVWGDIGTPEDVERMTRLLERA